MPGVSRFPKINLPYVDPKGDYESAQNWRYLNHVDWGGTGGRWATLVIAASDSTVASKAGADYVCNGGNDEQVINTAISVLEARGSATALIGRIVLLEGTFRLGAPILVNALGARTLSFEGMGAGSGISLTLGATRVIGGNSGATFDLNGSSTASGSAVAISNMQVTGSTTSAVIKSRDVAVQLDNVQVNASGSGGGISQTSSTGTGAGSYFRGCRVYSTNSGASGISVDVGSAVGEPIEVTDCFVKFTGSGDGIFCFNNASTDPTYIVSNCYVVGSSSSAGNGIKLSGNVIQNCVVSGNSIRACGVGITAGGYRHNIVGNVVEGCGVGISTDNDSQYLAVLANQISQSTTVGIRLANTAVAPSIIGNRIAASSQTYAITVAGGVTNAGIFNNDTYGGFVTAAVSDLGTGTRQGTGVPAGGLTNYVLKKSSGADGDYAWALDPALAVITANGDILIGTGSTTAGVLSVASTPNGTILETDSAAANKLKWGRRITASSTTPSGFPAGGDIWLVLP